MKIRALAGFVAFSAFLLASVPARAEFITYSYQVTNISEIAQLYTFTFLSPYALGPYDTLYTEFASDVTDLDDSGGANVSPADASGFMAVPQIDAVNFLAAALGDGCGVNPAPGSTVICDPFASATVGVATPAVGTFGVTVSFFLTGGDRASGSGRVELLNRVVAPEPASIALLGLGLAFVALRLRRRRTAS